VGDNDPVKTNKTLCLAAVVVTCLMIFAASCGLRHTPRFPQLNEHRVSSIGSFDIPVHWSPDGQYLAYQDGNAADVIIQDVTTGRSWYVGTHVPHPDGPIHTFAWHPSGHISYMKWRYALGGVSTDGVEELHLADVDGQNDAIVVDNLPSGVDYVWLPDGRELIMRWAARPSNYPIDDVYIVDSQTGLRETLITHDDLNLGIISMALLPDKNLLLLNGTRELQDGRASYFVLYDLSQKQVIQEIHLDPLFASGRLPSYPNLRPGIGDFSLNYVRSGANRWIIGDFWAPAGECYNYAIYFFNLNDTSRNFCIPSDRGPIGAISVSPSGDRIAYTPADGPGRAWIMVAELTPEIRTQIEH
jgi:WD40 repeat protein